jgi:hypothetical protein
MTRKTEEIRPKLAENSRFQWVMEVAAVAAFLGVSVSAVGNYCQMGMPKAERGKYNLKDCFKWWLENIYAPKNATAQAKTDHERYMAAKADNEELKRDRLREALIPKERVVTEFASRAADLKTTLRAFRFRLAPTLEGKEREDIAHIMGKEIDLLLESFCRMGRYAALPAEDQSTPAKKPKPAKKKPAKWGKSKR